MILRKLVHTSHFKLLAPLAVVAACLAVFFELAEDLLEGEPHSFDTTLLLFFRNPADSADPIGPHWLELMMSDLTALGGFAVLILISLFAIGYLLLIRRYLSATLVALSGLSAMAFNQGLKLGFDRPRPDLVAHLAEVHTLSFPSGHAMLSAVIYLTLGVLLARTQPSPFLKVYLVGIAVFLTMAVGISRIYLGVHWPSDVLAGWCLGIAWSVSCLLMVRYLSRRGKNSTAN
jgi:undecaprenyl-diphosphatase